MTGSALSASDIIALWESGIDGNRKARILSMLAAASPGTAPADLAALDAGSRHARLRYLHDDLFGQVMVLEVKCPACSERLETELRTDELTNEPEPMLALTCPACAHSWTAPVEIDSILWRKIAARAKAILGEVVALAKAYGWSESDILAMSPARRRYYCDRIE